MIESSFKLICDGSHGPGLHFADQTDEERCDSLTIETVQVQWHVSHIEEDLSCWRGDQWLVRGRILRLRKRLTSRALAAPSRLRPPPSSFGLSQRTWTSLMFLPSAHPRISGSRASSGLGVSDRIVFGRNLAKKGRLRRRGNAPRYTDCLCEGAVVLCAPSPTLLWLPLFFRSGLCATTPNRNGTMSAGSWLPRQGPHGVSLLVLDILPWEEVLCLTLGYGPALVCTCLFASSACLPACLHLPSICAQTEG